MRVDITLNLTPHVCVFIHDIVNYIKKLTRKCILMHQDVNLFTRMEILML